AACCWQRAAELGAGIAGSAAAVAQGGAQTRRAAAQAGPGSRPWRPRALLLAAEPRPPVLPGEEIRAGQNPARSTRPAARGQRPGQLGTRSRPRGTAPAAQLLRAAAAEPRRA